MLKLDVGSMLAENIGAAGVSPMDFTVRRERLDRAAAELSKNRNQMPWRDLPYTQDALTAEILSCAAQLREWAENFVLLGIGGSALGPVAVQKALHHPYYNSLPASKRGGPRFFVLDNVDPERMSGLFDLIDPARTVFCVVSKSGDTLEPMSQFLTLRKTLETRLGPGADKRHVVCITDPGKGSLRQIAKENGYRSFPVPEGVGGRFSELCPVGLFPAAMCGVDIRALLAGAADMDRACQTPDLWENPAYLYAALLCMAMERGKNISVMMAYSDALRSLADWYAQLWAESLGKKLDRQGNVVHTGQTPIRALGVTDQHSQLQLYMEGPADKVVTFLTVERFRRTVTIPAGWPEMAYLEGVTFDQLMSVEQWATGYALARAGRPSLHIALPELTAHTIGGLLYFFEVATAFAGAYLNINAFDQPGVEAGKNAAYAYFGRPGYEERRKELLSQAKNQSRILQV